MSERKIMLRIKERLYDGIRRHAKCGDRSMNAWLTDVVERECNRLDLETIPEDLPDRIFGLLSRLGSLKVPAIAFHLNKPTPVIERVARTNSWFRFSADGLVAIAKLGESP